MLNQIKEIVQQLLHKINKQLQVYVEKYKGNNYKKSQNYRNHTRSKDNGPLSPIMIRKREQMDWDIDNHCSSEDDDNRSKLISQCNILKNQFIVIKTDNKHYLRQKYLENINVYIDHYVNNKELIQDTNAGDIPDF